MYTQTWLRSPYSTELNFEVAELQGKQSDSSSCVAFSHKGSRICDPVVGGNLIPSPCSMAAEAGGIPDRRHTNGIPNFDGADAKWESWRVKFEVYADLAGVGAHLDIAAEKTAYITNDGLDAGAVLVSRTVHALLITKCEGEALSLVSLVPRRHGLEAWRVLKDECERKGGHRMAALLRGSLKPRARLVIFK